MAREALPGFERGWAGALGGSSGRSPSAGSRTTAPSLGSGGPDGRGATRLPNFQPGLAHPMWHPGVTPPFLPLGTRAVIGTVKRLSPQHCRQHRPPMKMACSFALSMVHLRAMALMHRREKEKSAQEIHVVATRTTDKILVTFLKQ